MNVREERTGWRDEGLSNRHRMWGWDCPAVDLDFVLIEYDKGRASALVEYKNEHAAKQDFSKSSYRALSLLASNSGIPALFCRYADDFSKFRVSPLNNEARKRVHFNTDMTEIEYVSFLYKIRNSNVPQEVLDKIRKATP